MNKGIFTQFLTVLIRYNCIEILQKVLNCLDKLRKKWYNIYNSYRVKITKRRVVS